MEASSLLMELTSHADSIALLTLELSTDDVETFEEVPADSWSQFAGKINGNIGMFFGFSMFHLRLARCVKLILKDPRLNIEFTHNHYIYRKIRDPKLRPRQEMVGILLFLAAFSWSLSNYQKFSENRIRSVQYVIVFCV